MVPLAFVELIHSRFMSSLNTSRNLEDCCNVLGSIPILFMYLGDVLLDVNTVSIASLDLTVCAMFRNYISQL